MVEIGSQVNSTDACLLEKKKSYHPVAVLLHFILITFINNPSIRVYGSCSSFHLLVSEKNSLIYSLSSYIYLSNVENTGVGLLIPFYVNLFFNLLHCIISKCNPLHFTFNPYKCDPANL